MKRVLIVLLMIFSALPTLAQEHLGDYWTSGCDPDASAVFAPVMGQERYAAACDALDRCMQDNDGDRHGALFCEFAVYDALVNACQSDDDACDFESSFYMASLLIFDPAFMWYRGYYIEPADIQEIMPAALVGFRAGDYQAVLELYENLPNNYETVGSPLQPFIEDLLIDKGLGNPDAVSDLYWDSIREYRTPFVTYQHARFLAEQGFPDAAGVEGLYLEQLAEIFPLARPAADEILTNYPFPDDLLEEWVVYPIEGQTEGPTDADLSMVAGDPLQLAFLSDGSLLMIGLPDRLSILQSPDTSGQPGLALLIQAPTGVYHYSSRFINDIAATVRFEGNFATIHWGLEGMMWSDSATLFLGKADEPDPRVERYQRCEGGARWRLSVGAYGVPDYVYYLETSYYDGPEGNPVATFSRDSSRFQVTDGPVCVDGVAWWQIHLLTGDDTLYWIPEASNMYFERDGIFTYLFHTIPAPE